jgi:hypothetical protein
MIKRISPLLVLLGCMLLISSCDTSMIIMKGSEGSGTPTLMMGPDNSVAATTITIDSTSVSTATIAGLNSTYRAGDVAKFNLVFLNRGGGVLVVDYQVRLMNQDQSRPREYAYGTGGKLVLYPTETTPITQQVQLPADLTPGAYVMNVFISRVQRDNQTIAENLSLSQTVNITK